MGQSVLLKRHIPQAVLLGSVVICIYTTDKTAEGEEKFFAGKKFILVTRSRMD